MIVKVSLLSKALAHQSHGDCKITYRKTTEESSPVIQGCLSLGGISYLCVILFLSSLPTFVLVGLWLSDVFKTVFLTLEVEIGTIANTFDCTHPNRKLSFFCGANYYLELIRHIKYLDFAAVKQIWVKY